MIVTRIEAYNRTKFSVFIDGELAFCLYKGELNKYGLREGEPIRPEKYEEILHVLLPKRAKLRCMNLLQTKSYTRKQLTEKLLSGQYPHDVVEEALSYVESFGYVNDLAYAVSYVEDHMDKKSMRSMEEELRRRGISRDDVEEALRQVQEREGEQDEEGMIRALLEKKHYAPETADLKERRRVEAFLFRRGFAPDKIRKVMG